MIEDFMHKTRFRFTAMLDQRKPTGPVLAGAREAFDGCVDAFLTVAAPAASVAAA